MANDEQETILDDNGFIKPGKLSINTESESSTWNSILTQNGGALHSNTDISIQSSTGSIKANNVKAKSSLDLGDSEQASMKYNSVDKSIDFIIK